jgi:hypothetical protein
MTDRQCEQVREIEKRWVESEYRLKFLRSFSSQPLSHPNPDQLLAWDTYTKQQCSVWEPN